MIENETVTNKLSLLAPHKAVSRKLNRVGSQAPEIATSEIRTLGQRLAMCRLGLNLTQAQVAKQVQFQHKTGRRRGTVRPLSRNAYAMYEIDLSEPDLKKIEVIAQVLGVTPDWLAFGDGEYRCKMRH